MNYEMMQFREAAANLKNKKWNFNFRLTLQHRARKLQHQLRRLKHSDLTICNGEESEVEEKFANAFAAHFMGGLERRLQFEVEIKCGDSSSTAVANVLKGQQPVCLSVSVCL